MTELFPITAFEHHAFWEAELGPPSYVYVMRAGPYGPVKVGKARNAYDRMASLQTGNPEKLRLHYVLPGDEALERHLHTQMRHAKLHGEWFDYERAEPQIEAISRMADGMKRAFEEGDVGFSNFLNFDDDGNWLTEEQRNANYEAQVDDCWSKVAVKKARRERMTKERDSREFARAQAIPTFTPHKPS